MELFWHRELGTGQARESACEPAPEERAGGGWGVRRAVPGSPGALRLIPLELIFHNQRLLPFWLLLVRLSGLLPFHLCQSQMLPVCENFSCVFVLALQIFLVFHLIFL